MSVDYDTNTGEILAGTTSIMVNGWDDGPIDKLAAALAKAQGSMTNAVVNKTNPHFRSRYADLGSVRDATVPALSENELAIVQRIKQGEDGNFWLFTAMLHSSGQKLTSVYPLPSAVDRPQVFGSALTYARRYCWASLCGIASEEDDDAESAQNAPPPPPSQGRRPAAPKPNVLREAPKVAPAQDETNREPGFRDLVEIASKESDYARLDFLREQYQPQLKSLKERNPDGFQKLEDSLAGIYTAGLILSV